MGNPARAVRRVSAFAACLTLAAGYGCGAKVQPEVTPGEPASSTVTQFVAAEVIADVKDFAVTLGGDATGNFVRSSDRRISDTRCYFTGKLELPAFYSSLHMVREDEERCAARGGENDVFFYPVQPSPAARRRLQSRSPRHRPSVCWSSCRMKTSTPRTRRGRRQRRLPKRRPRWSGF